MHNEREHGWYSPSQAERFFLCPGSVNLLRRLPSRPPSKYALKGTKAHEIIQHALVEGIKDAAVAHSESVHCCEEFEPSFIRGIQECIDWVYDTLAEVNLLYGDAQLFVETKVDVPCEAAPGEADGHCDIGIYSATAAWLWVADYKNGVVVKDVEDNKQALQYGAGFIYGETSPIKGQPIEGVTLAIIQPHGFHPDGTIREYNTTPGAILDYLFQLEEAVKVCQRPDAPLIPGAVQCQFCDARSECPAIERQAVSLLNANLTTVNQVTAPRLPDPTTIDVNRLTYIRSMRNMIDSWFNDVDQRLYELMMQGVDAPGLKLVQPHPRREWYGDEAERATKLAAYLGIKPEDLYRTSFRTITDVEEEAVAIYKSRVGKSRKKQAAQEAKQMLSYFTDKQTSGNLSIAPVTDSRPAVNKALQSFGNVVIIEPPTKGENQ